MKKRFLQIALASLLAMFLLPVIADAQSVKVNFTGTWILNAAKSARSAYPTTKIVASQDAETLTLTSTMMFNGKPSVATVKFKFDGNNQTSDENYRSTTTITWSDDGKTMNKFSSDTYIGKERMDGPLTSGAHQTWTLQDSKTLVITSFHGDAPGEVTIYEKK
jgi:hypothetical protein